MLELINSSERKTFLMSGSEPSMDTNVKLDTSNEGYVVAASGVTDQIIGSLSRVEAGGKANTWQVTVALVGPIKRMSCTGSIAIGARMVPDSGGLLISQAVNLSGSAFKHSPGIALQANTSGAATLQILQNSTYIPV